MALLALLTPGLLGFDYGATILVRSDSDIHELYYLGEIDAELRDQLLDLLDDPIDHNSASREDLYLLPEITYTLADAIIAQRDKLPYDTPRQLRDLVGRRTWNQIRPFVVTTEVSASSEPIKGNVSLRYTDQFTDQRAPVIYAKSRQRYHKWLEAGLIVAEQSDLYGVEYGEKGITVEGRRPSVMLERIYLSAERGDWSVIAGHYKIGFGQRLTFDVTEKLRPHGFSNDLKIYKDYENYDSYTVPKRMLGVAASTRRHLGDQGAYLDVTVFASSNHHDMYENDFTPSDVQVTDTDEIQEVGDSVTFPWLYREDLLGLNTSLFWSKRTHLGFTAWGGHLDKRYDFAFTSYALPNRDFYGAAGVDGAYGAGAIDLYAEATVTDTGGFGARVESLLAVWLLETSLAFRYYGTGFDNPKARAKSEPDEFGLGEDDVQHDEDRTGGWRDRDELGPQLELSFDPLAWVRLRAKGDLWYQPSEEVTNAYLEGRLDLDPLSWAGVDLVAYLRDKDISQQGRELSYDTGNEAIQAGLKSACGAGLRLQPWEPTILQVFAKDIAYDHSSYADTLAHDRYGWVKLIVDVTEQLELTARAKHYQERVDTPDSGKAYNSAYGQVKARLPGKITTHVRYEQVHDLDDPEADPNPQRKLELGVDFRF